MKKCWLRKLKNLNPKFVWQKKGLFVWNTLIQAVEAKIVVDFLLQNVNLYTKKLRLSLLTTFTKSRDKWGRT